MASRRGELAMVPTGTSRSHDVIHSIRSGFRDAAAGENYILAFFFSPLGNPAVSEEERIEDLREDCE
jgi:hypothetical protein